MNVTVRLTAEIGHRILGHEGKCQWLHGHSYVFEVSVVGKPNALGMIIDFKDLKRMVKEIIEPFDHALVLHADDPAAETLKTERLVLLSVNPTAENLASLIYGKMVDRNLPPARVIVRETEDGWACAEAVDRSVRITAVQ